jgi:hypothetical protein
MFRPSSLPIIRSLPLYIRHWLVSCRFDDRFQAESGWNGVPSSSSSGWKFEVIYYVARSYERKTLGQVYLSARLFRFCPFYFHSTSAVHSVFCCRRTDHRPIKGSVTTAIVSPHLKNTKRCTVLVPLSRYHYWYTQDITLCDYANWFTARLPFPSTETHVVCPIFHPRQPPSTHAHTHAPTHTMI